VLIKYSMKLILIISQVSPFFINFIVLHTFSNPEAQVLPHAVFLCKITKPFLPNSVMGPYERAWNITVSALVLYYSNNIILCVHFINRYDTINLWVISGFLKRLSRKHRGWG
jgi:hypothetical protein